MPSRISCSASSNVPSVGRQAAAREHRRCGRRGGGGGAHRRPDSPSLALVRILLRADLGFARAELMAWCEANGVHFLFGLAKTDRLIAEIKAELEGVAA